MKYSSISVDMIDLSIDINDYDFEKYIKPVLSKLDPRIEYWESLNFKSYRHNFRISGNSEPENLKKGKPSDVYSFYIGYSLNSKSEFKDRFKLSYNPNKVRADDPILEIIINYMKMNRFRVKINSADIALDYEGVSTSNLILDKRYKRHYSYYHYPGSDRTIYIGKPGSGQVKVYDKASESNLRGLMTRFEISLGVDTDYILLDSYKVKESIPVLYIKYPYELYNTSDLKDSDKLLLFSVLNGYPLDRLDYRNRKKFDRIVSSQKGILGKKIEPSQLDIEKALKSYVQSLLEINTSVQNYNTK